jgi:hypothetical protein
MNYASGHREPRLAELCSIAANQLRNGSAHARNASHERGGCGANKHTQVRAEPDSGAFGNRCLPMDERGNAAKDGVQMETSTGRSEQPTQSTWRGRARTHYRNILDLLRVRGTAGVLSSELYDCPEKFGRSPRNRISEMRRDGFSIRTLQVNSSTVRYILQEGPQDWYTRETGKPRAAVVPEKSTTDDLPLFAGVR